MEQRPPGRQRFSVFHRSADEEAGRRAWHHAYAEVFRGFGSVLDVGCGTGVFLDLLRERGVERVLGVDRDPEMVADTRARGHEARVLDARTQLDALGERFDGIHLAFVIETMDGDEGLAMLRACAALLKPDGLLVVRTLNPRNAAIRDGSFWLEPWAKRPWPLETLHVVLTDLGLRIVGAGNEPEGWQHVYILGRAPAAPRAHDDRVAVAFQGEFFAYNSMATVNRELASALRAHADVAPLIVPDEPAPEPSVAGDPRFGALRAAMRRGVPACDVLIRQSNGAADFRRPDGVGALVQILPWEYGMLPRAWVDALREGGADEVWTPTEYCRTMFLDAGIAPDRVAVVPNGIDPERFSPERALEPYPLATRASFRFLFIGGALPRKGVDVLLAAYRRAFTRGDDVALVLKLFGTQTFYQLDDGGAALRAFANEEDAPELLVIDEELSDEDVVRLYRSCDALAFPYRGEGFGLPMLEALACGLPVIATAGGAADAFLDDDVAYRVPAERVALRGTMRGETLAGEGWWLEPDVGALAATLRHVAAHRDEARAKALRGSQRARTDWTWERAATVAAERLRGLLARTSETTAR
ncbi:MAG: methyltransferase domain-containing protein [Candidatus Eremiobacteraeota bacterium]|nr:methyltransferase domain-containing protein [Candidatus Eremiobacteraeota bacterium]